MRISRWFSAAVVAAALAGTAHARDISGFHETIHIKAGDEVGDVACAFCTITIDEPVQGDVALAFSDVTFGPNSGVHGDVASAFTDMQFRGNTVIDGDLARFGGNMDSEGSLQVNGSKASVPGPVATLIVLAPFAVIAGIIWLIVALIRRRRMNYPPPGYYPPPGVPRQF